MASLHYNGDLNGELSRRLGMARLTFLKLSRVWRRSCLSCKRKVHILHALVFSKLLYGLSTGCLSIAQQRKINGFQARCLRAILRIPPAFLSRISNAEVLRRAGSPKLLTDTIKDVQVAQLGRVLRSSPQQPLRKAACAHGLSPVVSHYIRRVGRPRREWVPTVLEEAQRRCSGRGDLEILASDQKTWKKISTCSL